MALECMRGAARQGRLCYLYAFSGPQQCQELLLDHSPGSMAQLLDFLSHSFLGGTDVDTPFLRSLDRLTQDAWHLADILLVRWATLCCAASAALPRQCSKADSLQTADALRHADEQVSALQVTDGEIPPANEDVKSRLAAARDTLELKVHCLLVAEDPTKSNRKHPLLDIIDRLHVFTSWSSA